MAKLWQFWQGHQKPAFSEKVQRRDQGKFLKNRPKKLTSIKRPKSTLEEMALSCNSYAIQVRALKMILVQKAAPKVPERSSCCNFGKVTQTRIF